MKARACGVWDANARLFKLKEAQEALPFSLSVARCARRRKKSEPAREKEESERELRQRRAGSTRHYIKGSTARRRSRSSTTTSRGEDIFEWKIVSFLPRLFVDARALFVALYYAARAYLCREVRPPRAALFFIACFCKFTFIFLTSGFNKWIVECDLTVRVLFRRH